MSRCTPELRRQPPGPKPEAVDNVAAARRLFIQALLVQALREAYSAPPAERHRRIQRVKAFVELYDQALLPVATDCDANRP